MTREARLTEYDAYAEAAHGIAKKTMDMRGRDRADGVALAQAYATLALAAATAAAASTPRVRP